MKNFKLDWLILPLLGHKESKELEERGGADFALNIHDVGRFRLNIYRQRGVLSMSARCVKTDIPSIEQLNLPPSLKELRQGLEHK